MPDVFLTISYAGIKQRWLFQDNEFLTKIPRIRNTHSGLANPNIRDFRYPEANSDLDPDP